MEKRSQKVTTVRAESGDKTGSDRSQRGKRPQSERKATAVRAESDRSQSGKQEVTAFRAEISLARIQFVGQLVAHHGFDFCFEAMKPLKILSAWHFTAQRPQ